MQVKSVHVARLIKERMAFLKMTQLDLSKKLGMSSKNAQFVHNILKGKCQLPPKYINNISSILSLSRPLLIEAMADDYYNCLRREAMNDH